VALKIEFDKEEIELLLHCIELYIERADNYKDFAKCTEIKNKLNTSL
jgi:hypothetical protein